MAALVGCCFPGARGQYSLQLQTNNNKKKEKKNKTKGVTKNKGFSKNEQEKGKKMQSHIPQFQGWGGGGFSLFFFFFFLRFFRAEILKILIKRKKERVEAILQALALPCEAQQQSLGSLAPNRD